MKRRIIAALDWVVRLFVNDPPHPLPPGRWQIVVRPDGSKAFNDRYGDRTDIEIIENSSIPHGEVYLIDRSFMDAMTQEPGLFLPDAPVPDTKLLLSTAYAQVPKPVKLIVSGD